MQQSQLALQAQQQQQPCGCNLEIAQNLVGRWVHILQCEELDVVVQPVYDGWDQEKDGCAPMSRDACGLWTVLFLSLQEKGADEQFQELCKQRYSGKVVIVPPIYFRRAREQSLHAISSTSGLKKYLTTIT